MTWVEVLILIASGVLVGFINTLAGGGTIISIALFMILGLPANVANGTNRIAVVLQNFTSAHAFSRQKLLPQKRILLLAIPTTLGAIVGAFLAVDINEVFFRRAMAVVMLLMLFFIFYKPAAWLKGNEKLINQKHGWTLYLLFFGIGFYGGFIQIGVGYLLLAGAVFGAGYNLMSANVIKVYLVLIYTLFALLVFVFHNQVVWKYGLVHAIGNIIGAWISARMAIKHGVGFVRWVLVVIILVFSLDLLGVYSIKEVLIHGL